MRGERVLSIEFGENVSIDLDKDEKPYRISLCQSPYESHCTFFSTVELGRVIESLVKAKEYLEHQKALTVPGINDNR